VFVKKALTKGKGSVLVTSYKLALDQIFLFCYKTCHPNEEVNCTKPSLSVSAPCIRYWV
jgi:hypothetical protein